MLGRDACDSAHIRFVLVVPLLRTVLDWRLDGVLLLPHGSSRFLLLLWRVVFGAQGVFRGGVDLLSYLGRLAAASSWGQDAATCDVGVSAILEILVHRVDLDIIGIVSVGSPVTVVLLLNGTLGTTEVRSGSLLLLSGLSPVVTDVGIGIILRGIEGFLDRHSVVLNQDGVLRGTHAVLLDRQRIVEVIGFLQRIGSGSNLDVAWILRRGLRHSSVHSLGRWHRAGLRGSISNDECARASGQMRVVFRQIVASLRAGSIIIGYLVSIRLVVHMDQMHRLLLQIVRHGLVRRDHVARRDVLVDEELVVGGDDVHVVVFDPLVVVVRRHHQSVAVGEDEFLHLLLAHHLHLLFIRMGHFPEALLLSLILLKISLRVTTTFAVVGSARRSLLLDSAGSSWVGLNAPVFEEGSLGVIDGVIIVGVEHSSAIP